MAGISKNVTCNWEMYLPERLSTKAWMRQLRIPAYVKLALRIEMDSSEKALFSKINKITSYNA